MGHRRTKPAPIDRKTLDPEIFKRWQRNHRLTGAAVSRVFQVDPNTVVKWRTKGVPVLVMWAMIGYTDGHWRPKNLKDLIKPPVRQNDMRRKNIPPQAREGQAVPEGPKGPPRKVYVRPVAPQPEWPLDPTYDE